MSSTTLKAAILIISDTASRDPAADTTGNVLKEVFSSDSQDHPWEVVGTKIVPDHITKIQRAITHWTDRDVPVNLIVTSGGTGFAVKDNTPEVRSSLSWAIKRS